MMKIGRIFYCICILSLCFSQKAKAQNEIDAIKVEYIVTFENEDKEIGYLLAEMFDGNNTALRAYVTKDYLRIEEYGFAENIQIIDIQDSTSFVYLPSEIASGGQKIAYATSPTVPKIVFSDDLNTEPVIVSGDDMELELTDDVQIIEGRTCHLARFKVDKENEIWVWYDKSLPQLFFGEYDYLERVPGLPLKIVNKSHAGNLEGGVVANKVEFVKVNSSIFELPEGFKLSH